MTLKELPLVGEKQRQVEAKSCLNKVLNKEPSDVLIIHGNDVNVDFESNLNVVEMLYYLEVIKHALLNATVDL